MIDELALLAVDPWWITALRIGAAVVIVVAVVALIRRTVMRRHYFD